MLSHLQEQLTSDSFNDEVELSCLLLGVSAQIALQHSRKGESTAINRQLKSLWHDQFNKVCNKAQKTPPDNALYCYLLHAMATHYPQEAIEIIDQAFPKAVEAESRRDLELMRCVSYSTLQKRKAKITLSEEQATKLLGTPRMLAPLVRDKKRKLTPFYNAYEALVPHLTEKHKEDLTQLYEAIGKNLELMKSAPKKLKEKVTAAINKERNV